MFKEMCFIAITGSIAFTAVGAQAQDYYKDKSIRLIIGTDAGGGYDFSARLVAGHIARSIPGAPHIVPQNMPGADSLIAGNYIYNAAPQDGSVICLRR